MTGDSKIGEEHFLWKILQEAQMHGLQRDGRVTVCRRISVTYQTSCDSCRSRNAVAEIADNAENAAYWGETAEVLQRDLRTEKGKRIPPLIWVGQ